MNETQEDPSFLWFVGVMLRERRRIITLALIGVLAALALLLSRGRVYSTYFTFVPQENKAASAAGLAGLASQFGVSLGALGGDEPPPELYVDLIMTREVLTPIVLDSVTVAREPVERRPLLDFLRISDGKEGVRIDKGIRKMRRKVISAGISNRATGMVKVTVRTGSAPASLEIAERLLNGMTMFNLHTRQSQARAEREFTEKRVEEARDDLRGAESALQGFLERNRVLDRSPSLQFERDRLQREVAFLEQVHSSLAEQYEEARIKEVRDTPVITMIERPVEPARADSRMALLVLLAGGLAGAFVGQLIVIAREGLAREKLRGRDPALALIANEWADIRKQLGFKRS